MIHNGLEFEYLQKSTYHALCTLQFMLMEFADMGCDIAFNEDIAKALRKIELFCTRT